MRCGGCSKQVRKTSIVYVGDASGGFKRKRLGACCSKGAVTLLAGSVEGAACKCGKPATSCNGCARDAAVKDSRKPLTKAIVKLRSLAKAYEGSSPSRAAGLEQAADLLEGGDFS